jgi:tetratricopeptide (TPR) repeat protein
VATQEENYPKALSSMHRVLELDPDFHTALYHIFDVLAYNNDWEGMINFDSKYNVNIPGKIQNRVLRAYEVLGQLEKADKYYEKIEQTLISTDPTGEGLCYINAQIAYELAGEDSLFQRAKYYAEKGIKICSPPKPENGFFNQNSIIFIGSTYELENADAGKKAYYQLINNMDIKDRFLLTSYIGKAFYRSVNNTKFNLTYDDALFYQNLAIDLSKQLESQKYFTKAVYYYHRTLYKAKGSEFSLQKMEEQINKHCGSTINMNCYALHEKSSQTFQVLYDGGAYELANKIGQFILDTYNMGLAENLLDEDDTQYFTQMSTQLHYSLGMIKFKKGDYNNARQNFYTAL